jgi:hypothetical protein
MDRGIGANQQGCFLPFEITGGLFPSFYVAREWVQEKGRRIAGGRTKG